MNSYDIVIIGGGPGGLIASRSARNTYPDKSILLVRREKQTLIPCGIPYIFHSLESPEDDLISDAPLKARRIDLMVDEVIDGDPDKKILTLGSGVTVGYDRLLLALGSRPFLPPLPGIDLDGVFSICKEVDRLKVLKERMDTVNKVTIIGGGFIGVEVADELSRAGKEITLIEALDDLLSLSMDHEFGDSVRDILEGVGVKVRTGARVKAIRGDGSVSSVLLEDGTEIPTQLVIMATGYRPEVGLARKMELEVDERNGISVDEYMRCSGRDIFAIGDCAAKSHFLTGKPSSLMLASTAVAQGRFAGTNLFELKIIKEFPGTLSTFSTKIEDTAFGSVGLTETEARKLGVAFLVGHADSMDRHPGKMPGGSSTHMKLIYAKYSHQILGAQVRGGDSVGELVNMLSVMIQKEMTDVEINILQIGTHPLLTPAPTVYPIIDASVDAIMNYWPHM